MGFNSPPLGGCFLTPSPSGDSADVPFLLYLLSSTFLFLFSLPFPSPLPSSLSVFLRWKAGSSRQPFVTVPYLNCFHGFPFRSIHTNGGVPPLLPCLHSFSLSFSLYGSKLSQGLFRRGIFDFLFSPSSPLASSLPRVQAGNLAYFRTARPESPRPPRARSIWFIASTRYVFLYIFSLFFFWRYISQSHSVVRLSLLWKYMEFYLFIYFFFGVFFKFRRDESFLYFYNF